MVRERFLRRPEENVRRKSTKSEGRRRKLYESPSHRRELEIIKGKNKTRELSTSDSEYESYDSSPRPFKSRTKRKIPPTTDKDSMYEENRVVCKNDTLKDLLDATTSDDTDKDVKGRTKKQSKKNGEKNVKKSQPHYRCNLKSSIKDLKELQFREHHILEIKRTPLWFMFNAIYNSNTKVLMKRCSKHDDDIRQIMSCFDEVSERFMIGGEFLPLTNRDVQLILGVSGGADYIQLKRREHETPNWIRRCFGAELDSARGSSFTLYKNHILEKLKVMLSSNDHTSIQDVARLTYSYLLVVVLLPNQNGCLALNLASYLEDFDYICHYNWSTVIVELLKSQLDSNKSLKAGGCVMLLPFWLCEHLTLIEADEEDAFPRFLKWDLNKLSKKLIRVDVSKLSSRYIRKIDLKPTASEKDSFEELLNYWEQSSQATQEQGTNVDGMDTESSRFLAKNQSASRGNLRCRSDTPGTPDDLEYIIAIATAPAATTHVKTVGANKAPASKREIHEKVASISTEQTRGDSLDLASGGTDSLQKSGDPSLFVDGNSEMREKVASTTTNQGAEFESLGGSELGVGAQSEKLFEITDEPSFSLKYSQGLTPNVGGDKLLVESENVVDSVIGVDDLVVHAEKLVHSSVGAEFQVQSEKNVDSDVGVDELVVHAEKVVDLGVCVDELVVHAEKVVDGIDEPSYDLKYSQAVTPVVVLDQKSDRGVGELVIDDLGVSVGDVIKSQDENAILSSLRQQIVDFNRIIGEKDIEIETLKGIQLEMREKQQSTLKEAIRRVLIRENDNRAKLEDDVKRLEKEKTDQKASFEAEMKEKDNSISCLQAENQQLVARVKEILIPSSTQVLENPENLARIDEMAELAKTKIEHDRLVKENADLAETLVIYEEIEQVVKEATPCINKKKRSARTLSPSTLTKRVKNRTVNEERKKTELTPQLNTRELVNVHEILSDDENTPIKEFRRKKAPPPFALDESHWAVRKTTDRIRSLAKDYWERNSPRYVVWIGAGPIAYVTVENIVSILHHERISDRVVDAWGELLLEMYAEKNYFPKTRIFSSLCWGLISGGASRNTGTLSNLVDGVLEKSIHQDLLVFPLLTNVRSNTPKIGGDHWTLLVLNLSKCEWSFYNSMLPRRKDGTDHHLTKAMIVVSYVEKKLRDIFRRTNKHHPLLRTQIKKPVQCDCPQQDADSVDCGVIVCFNLESIVLKKKIKGGEYSDMKAGNYRKKMAEWFTDSINIKT